MIVTSEIDLRNFEGWSGAEDTLAMLSYEEINTLQFILEDLYPEGIDEGNLNDILRFENDWIAEMLGYTDWECLERCKEYGDIVTVKITDVKWDVDEDEDCDEEDINLPTEIIHEFDYHGDNDELEEEISDWLSDEYGFCHDGFNYEIIKEEE